MKNRAFAVTLLVVGLLVGYAAADRTVTAQVGFAEFPFNSGDTVNLVADIDNIRGGQTCVVDVVRGHFLVCKSDTDRVASFNLDKISLVTRVGKGTR